MTWLWMLNKRLYKRLSFVIILVLIPLCALGLSVVSGSAHGFVTVAMSGDDGFSDEIMDNIERGSSLVTFKRMSEADALASLRSGKADAAWIFRDGAKHKTEQFVKDFSDRDAVVTVVVREKSVVLHLVCEKLSGALFDYAARVKYIDFAKTKLSELSDAELMEYYDAVNFDSDLFLLQNTDGSSTDIDYLLSPVRGLVATLLLVGTMAATVFTLQDRQGGAFSALSGKQRFFVSLASSSVAALNIAAVAVISLWLSGVAGNIFYELVTAVVFALGASAFCIMLSTFFKSASAFCALIPIAALGSLILCSVFIRLPYTDAAAHLLPVTYYLASCHDLVYLIYMILYAGAMLAVCAVKGVRE